MVISIHYWDEESILTVLENYGFPYFLESIWDRIDMTNKKSADAVDAALSKYRPAINDETFSISRALLVAMDDTMETEKCSKEEALEIIADEGYVLPVHIAMYYSSNAGDTDVERLSSLLRTRAAKLLAA